MKIVNNSAFNVITKSLNHIFLVSIVGSLLLLSACGDDDPIEPENPEELITTLTMTFTPQGGGAAITARYFDEDGADGPTAPVSGNATLAANTVYNVELMVLNESESPAENVTEEVLAEDEEHQFFFAKTSNLNITFAYADMDGDGNPVGVTSVFTTGDASTGQLSVILRHEPVKSADGVSEGIIANANGETDIETTPPFDIVIQ